MNIFILDSFLFFSFSAFSFLYSAYFPPRTRLIKGEKENAADDGAMKKKGIAGRKKGFANYVRFAQSSAAVINALTTFIQSSDSISSDFHTIKLFHIKPNTFFRFIIKIARWNEKDR